MSTAIKTGWLNNKNGDKFAPKTLSSQVITADGSTLEGKIQANLDALESTKADKEHVHDVSDISGLDTMVSDVQTNLDEHIADSDVHFTSTERTKLSGIASGAQVNTITGVKGDAESSYRVGKINITPTNIGLGNVNNTSDINKPVSTAQQAAIDEALSEAKTYADELASGKANSSHTHDDIYYTEVEVDSKLSAVNTSITNITSGSTPVKEAEHAESADTATNATNANHATTADNAAVATKATQDASGNVITDTYETKEDAQLKYDELVAAKADWNQNDETAIDYIKNRPFYEGEDIEEIIVPEATYNCSLDGSGIPYIQTMNLTLSLKDGVMYEVYMNGAVYTLKCSYITSGLTQYMFGDEQFTSAPFYITYVPMISLFKVIFNAQLEENKATICIKERIKNIKKIERKFVDDIAGMDVEGKTFSIDDVEYTALNGAEIFNDYENNIAVGQYSHAEGTITTAIGNGSHAEGCLTTASELYSHAEGYDTTAAGAISHAEGSNTVASGNYSHAEGHGTIAHGESQHVQGSYNIEDTENKYAHIVGNGKNNTRSNAHTIDWDGNAWFAGNVYVGGDNQDSRSKLITESELDTKLENLVTGGITVSNAEKDADGNVITDTYETKTDAQLKYDELTAIKAEKNHSHSWNDLEDKPFNAEAIATWDGNTSDKIAYSFNDSATPIRYYFVKSYDEIGINTYDMPDALYATNSYTVGNDWLSVWGMPKYIYTVEDSVKVSGEWGETTFGEAGLYFAGDLTGGYVDLVESINHIDEKYIQDTIARTEYVDANFALKSDLQNIDLSSLETKEDSQSKLDEAKSYADEKVANLLDNSTEAVDSVMELAEAMKENSDAIKALETVAASKVPTSRKINNKELTSDITLSASDVGADASGSAGAVQTNLDTHIADAVKHITATERTNWGAAYTHSTSAHAPSDAQANVIESIKVNGTAQTITSKSVNITVPTDNSQLDNGAGYITSSDIANKADKSTTLAGYGITNAYTKTEVDTAISDNKTTVDTALSSTSTNPVQNKVINSAIATATSAITANTNSINAHSTAITNLQTAISEIQEITSADIQALFA